MVVIVDGLFLHRDEIGDVWDLSVFWKSRSTSRPGEWRTATAPPRSATSKPTALRRGEAGDPAGAATAFGQLLSDRLRVLGPNHPDTLTTRHNLAHWRGQAATAQAASEQGAN
jgi:hypothetical protein